MIDPVEQAWRIHAAQADWTGKVDSKASFAFGIESAALGATVALSAADRLFSQMSPGFAVFLYWCGLVALFGGAACSLLVVLPRLRGSDAAAREADENFIYFGHLRHWEAKELAGRLTADDGLIVIARQCVTMARIAWRKHRLVQASILSGAAGIAALVISGVLMTT